MPSKALWPAIIANPIAAITERGKWTKAARATIDTPIANHLGDKIVEMEVEAPAESHDRELDQYQPDAARGEKAADIARRTPLRAVQISGNSGQEDESRRAEMRHPAC
jgi:hypothetical protein